MPIVLYQIKNFKKLVLGLIILVAYIGRVNGNQLIEFLTKIKFKSAIILRGILL